MAKRPPILKLHELTPGVTADCFALLYEKTRTTTRDGKVFYNCRFRNARRRVAAAIWSDAPLFADCEAAWEPGNVYKLRCVYSEHERYGPKIDIVQIREATEEDEADGLVLEELLDKPRTSPDESFAALRQLAVDEFQSEPLQILTLKLVDDHAEEWKASPATLRQFYPYPGGLVEHTLAVARNCLWLADRYRERFPDIIFNRDLLLAAAILHDIGRLREISVSGPNPESTVEGRLLGAIALSRDMIRDTAKTIDGFDGELLMLLDHLVQSHLTLPEWGSPRLPMIPEALILHHADDLDAKFEMYARHLSRDASPGPFTERDPVLGKPLLKRRSV